ncbi:Hydroxylysine kinase [Stylophora pistillata]|uniref:Hydroxylysine kinase n=1 Tax=Stylophora pistillata TaxID=50429 RepID=A0A2B4R2I5_STYPI|nr:Hydroxylysine kinase [Stylophora pistillata]
MLNNNNSKIDVDQVSVKCRAQWLRRQKHLPGTVPSEPDHFPITTIKDTDGISLENGTSLLSVTNLRHLVDGIEIHDGEEYSEEEFFICAVLLLNFVPGKLLNEMPLNTQLLFNAGMAVGSLDRDLKRFDLNLGKGSSFLSNEAMVKEGCCAKMVYSSNALSSREQRMDFVCAKLQRPGFCWDLSRADEIVEQCLEAVTDPYHVQMVREVCEAFRKNVKPKLHLLPKQIIHGDANYSNLIFTPGSNGFTPYSVQDIGFIDFGDLNYSCKVFDIAISLMYILNVEEVFNCERTQMAGNFLAGYHSMHPLSSEELEVLPVLVASRFCQSLVFGAYISKHVDHGNEYILETAKNGWKNFEQFWKTPREGVLQLWLDMRENTRQN